MIINYSYNLITGARSTYGESRGAYSFFWWSGDLRERDHLEEAGLNGRIILKWFFRKLQGGPWTGLIWLRIGTNCGFHKMQGIS